MSEGWGSYEKLVLDKLDGQEEALNDLREEVVLLRIDVARLKVKAGLWGGAAGLVPGMIGVALMILGSGGSAGAG